jgi:hypothetical protein
LKKDINEMHKALLLIAAAASLVAAAPALAADGSVTVNGAVAPKCLFTVGSKTITIAELAGDDGKLNAATLNNKSATLEGWCNGTAARIQVAATPLRNSGTGGDSFDSLINYTATAVANSVTATDTTTTEEAGTARTVGLFAGGIVVSLSDAASAGAKLLLSGAYSGSVTVTLSPTA